MERTIHVSEVKDKLNKAERNKCPDLFELTVATLGSKPVVKYRGWIVGRYAHTERYRIKLEQSNQIRTFALCLIMDIDGSEVVW